MVASSQFGAGCQQFTRRYKKDRNYDGDYTLKISLNYTFETDPAETAYPRPATLFHHFVRKACQWRRSSVLQLPFEVRSKPSVDETGLGSVVLFSEDDVGILAVILFELWMQLIVHHVENLAPRGSAAD